MEFLYGFIVGFLVAYIFLNRILNSGKYQRFIKKWNK